MNTTVLALNVATVLLNAFACLYCMFGAVKEGVRYWKFLDELEAWKTDKQVLLAIYGEVGGSNYIKAVERSYRNLNVALWAGMISGYVFSGINLQLLLNTLTRTL